LWHKFSLNTRYALRRVSVRVAPGPTDKKDVKGLAKWTGVQEGEFDGQVFEQYSAYFALLKCIFATLQSAPPPYAEIFSVSISSIVPLKLLSLTSSSSRYF
jgi:hypothetical protein